MDNIADLLTRIRNAYQAGHKQVSCPASKQKQALLDLLKTAKYIKGYSVKENNLNINLRYFRGHPVIQNLKRISKPSCRIYVGKNKYPLSLSGFGHVIVSTSQGLMFARDAKKKNLGGELVCKVW